MFGLDYDEKDQKCIGNPGYDFLSFFLGDTIAKSAKSILDKKIIKNVVNHMVIIVLVFQIYQGMGTNFN